MRVYYKNDELFILGDEDVITRVAGEDLSTVEIDERVEADALARAYNDAQKGGVDRAKYYAAMKKAFIDQHALRN